MRFIKYFILVIIVVAFLGYGVYYFGTKIASEKLMDVVSTELLESGESNKIKQTIESNPVLQDLLEDAKSVDENELPFTTKEEAVRVIVKKIGIAGLQDIQSKVQQGQMTQEQLIKEAQKKFTDEEIEALIVIAYKEIYNK